MTKVSVPDVIARKSADRPLVMVTAYDFPSARIVDDAGVDVILVGDTVAMLVSGYEDTLGVSIDEMAYHVRAVANARPKALVVGDMPWMSYHLGVEDAVANAAKLIRAGAQAVKLEGGLERVDVVKSIVRSEIPVMGHLGLTPQSIHRLGGFRTQGRSNDAIAALLEDARALDSAGAFALVLEAVPSVVGRLITESVGIPTIGIGAGPSCDGQILLFHDLLGVEDRLKPRFVRRYASLKEVATTAVRAFAEDVQNHRYPSDSESYALPQEVIPPSRGRDESPTSAGEPGPEPGGDH